jgi:L-amino acid N-acyltransferase YncA
MLIRTATEADAEAICDIYNYYVTNTIITFEEEAVSIEEMNQRICETLEILPWIVLEEDGEVAGYAYASRWKSRCAYRYSVETTVYLSNKLTGKGFGSMLYENLIAELRKSSIHSLIGGIALPNGASVALHEKFGFEKVAQFKEVGWKFNQWIDVGYWELVLKESAM